MEEFLLSNKILYISDLDGTLLNSEKEVSDYSRTVINSLVDKGMHFTVATARTAATAVKILSGLKISAPVVLMNGVVIYDTNKDMNIKTEVIPTAAVCKIIRIFNKHGISGFMYTINNDKLVTYYENLDTQALKEFHDERVHKYNKNYKRTDSFLDIVEDNNIVYFCMIDEYNKLVGVLNELKAIDEIDMVLYKCIYSEDTWYLEIFSCNASKYNAVKYLREKYKYDRIVGFGDNFNDIALLKACDEFYAVSNGVDELKEKATGVIGDNCSDGVAKFLEEIHKHS